jgi:tetratricopeptide (TPR) repeat protein
VDAFAWEVVGSVAGVVAAVAALIALIPRRAGRKEVPQLPVEARDEALSFGAGEDVPVVVGEIPQAPLGFQPRTDLLAVLDASGSQSKVARVQAVIGMRGVGKTHLAAAYARAKLADRWRLVAWVNAEDSGGVLAGLAEVAAALDLAGAEAGDAQAAARAVRHWLETDGDRCLLVFDNATDPALLRPFVPAAGAAQVIITSNQQAVASLGSAVPVDVFSESQALTFLAARTGQVDAAAAQALAAELGYLPLALAQAAAVIASQRLDCGTYLERLRRLPVGDLLVAEEAGQYPRGVAAAVLFSLDTVRAGNQGVASGAVMDLLAVLSTAGVRRSLVHRAAEAGLPGRDERLPPLTPEVADRVLARLAGTSLLTFSLDGSAVTAHRLVMRVIQENLAVAGSLDAVCAAAADLLDAQVASLEETWREDRAATRELVEQIIALYEASTRCPPSSDLGTRMIRLRAWAIWFLNRLHDNPARVIVIGERLLADQEQALGPDHPDTLTTRNHLALAYWGADRTDEAIALGEQVLAARERVLGPDHPDTWAARSDLAATYRAAGRTDEAITLFEQVLANQEHVLGPDHRETWAARSDLAEAYRAAGRSDEAITLGEQVLANQEHVLAPDHRDILVSRSNLALAYSDAGRIGEAITLFEQVLADQEHVLGSDNYDILTARNDLAEAYRAAGRTDEAITLFEQVLADQEHVLAPDHPRTLQTRRGLAATYRAAGRTGEATKLDPCPPDL